MRTANAIFRRGCVTTGRALFIDRRLYVNSDPSRQLALVGCSAQAEVAYCFLNPTGKKTGEKEQVLFSLFHTHARLYTFSRLRSCSSCLPLLVSSAFYQAQSGAFCKRTPALGSKCPLPSLHFRSLLSAHLTLGAFTHTAFFLWRLFCLSDYAAGSLWARLGLTHVCVLCMWLVLKFGLFTQSLT